MTSFYEISEKTQLRVSEMLKNGDLSIVEGGLLEEFETAAAMLMGHDFAVATCNGTAAIHLAYFGAGIGKNDEVLVPTYGFHAMTSPILQLGGTPIFCDVNLDSLSIDIEDAQRQITENTKAIMVLQPWGNVARVDELLSFADENDVLLISDSSHAHGAQWDGKPLGEYYDVVCASMGKGKLITGGELGVLTTNCPRIRDRALLYGHTNRVPGNLIQDEYRTISNAIGIKYRPHKVALRIALDQMDNFDQRNSALRKRARALESVIEAAGFLLQKQCDRATRDYWKIVVMGSEVELQELKKTLRDQSLRSENNHYNTLQHEDTIFTDYYKIHSKRKYNVGNLERQIMQLDALSLSEDKIFESFMTAFEHYGE